MSDTNQPITLRDLSFKVEHLLATAKHRQIDSIERELRYLADKLAIVRDRYAYEEFSRLLSERDMIERGAMEADEDYLQAVNDAIEEHGEYA